MGLGKTLSVIATWDKVCPQSLVYVGPKTVLQQTELIEVPKWSPKIKPDLYLNYEYFQKPGKYQHLIDDPPQMLICDEAHGLKNPSALQTEGVRSVVWAMLDRWGDKAYVAFLSGTFAPQDPTDYWSPANILCPGFLIEGKQSTFLRRMAVLETRNEGNGDFKSVETWKDRDGIPGCANCGVLREDHRRDHPVVKAERCRGFVKTINEVKALHNRLSGKLFLFQNSEDYLNLPPLENVTIRCEVNQELLDLARGLAATAHSGADLLTKACQISDGFLYEEEIIGTKGCPDCGGGGQRTGLKPKDPENLPPMGPEDTEESYLQRYYCEGKITCDLCLGKGEVDKTRRSTDYLGSPKEDEFAKILRDNEEHKRFVAYGAFEASIDIMYNVAIREGWNVLRMDGRGTHTSWDVDKKISPLINFQSLEYDPRKILFLGQGGAAGAGLNLQLAHGVLYFSNDFNSKNRIQSEKRVHRYGSLAERIRCYDLFHFDTDLYVLNKVNIKRARMDLSTGIDVDMAEVLELLGTTQSVAQTL